MPAKRFQFFATISCFGLIALNLDSRFKQVRNSVLEFLLQRGKLRASREPAVVR